MLSTHLFRRAAVVLALIGAFILMSPSFANATTGDVARGSLITQQMIVAWVTTAAIGFVIPALTDLITKSTAPVALKNLVVLILAAVAAAIPAVTFVNGEKWTDYLFQVFIAFWSALTAHKTGYSGVIESATKNFGLTWPSSAAGFNAAYDPQRPDADAGDVGGPHPPARPSGTTNDLTGGTT